jgi:large subunit ribosomal protein L19
MSDIARSLDAPPNPNIPELRSGDTVSVHVRIKEGDRERVQEFRGTIITASHGIGVERTFLLRSPRIEKVEVQRSSHVRRAQLLYLRDRVGKRARLKEKRRT